MRPVERILIAIGVFVLLALAVLVYLPAPVNPLFR